MECPVDGITLVALPRDAQTAEELMRIGLSKNVAGLLAHDERESSMWCAVEDLGNQPVKQQDLSTTAEAHCVSADLTIEHAILALSRQVRLTIRRTASGQAFLESFDSVQP